VCRRLRAERPRLLIIILTARSDREAIIRAVSCLQPIRL